MHKTNTVIKNDENQLIKGITCIIDIFDFNENDTLTIIYNEPYTYITEILKNMTEKLNISINSIFIENTDDITIDLISDKHTNAKNLILITKNSLTHHKNTRIAVTNGAKVLSCVNISKEILLRAAAFDYQLLERITEFMQCKLENANEIKILNDGHTFVLSKKKRKLKADKIKLKPCGQCNFPIGEVCVAPIEISGNGTLKFDRMMVPHLDELLFLDNAVFDVKCGKIIDSKTESAKKIYKYLSDFENGTILAEFGMGTNPWTIFDSSIIESEKCLGTIHIAFGANKSLHGINDSKIHKDGIIQKPTVFFDGEKIIDNGSILIKEIKEIVDNLDS